MKTIYELMSITALQYETLIWKTYLKWCQSQAHNDTADLQKLLANRKMFNFFMVQITGLEVDLREEMQPYVHLKDGDAMIELWKKQTARIVAYYSHPIRNQARKINIINHIQSHDLRSLRN